jgi:hypothetical protein
MLLSQQGLSETTLHSVLYSVDTYNFWHSSVAT